MKIFKLGIALLLVSLIITSCKASQKLLSKPKYLLLKKANLLYIKTRQIQLLRL